MDLTHSFTVPAGVDETWAAFQDIESVAECFPGAQVTSADDEGFEGTVKVKLGPIALVYKGSGTFTERDEAAHKMVIDAKGKDKRGNGTAGALVTATMTPVDDGTKVEVVTDLSITGKPAQFGRGVIQDVSDKLLGQFVDCLQGKVGAGGGDGGPEETAAPAAESAPGASTPAPDAAAAAAPAPEQAATPQPAAAPAATAPKSGDDALDLGATVLPVMAKMYWKQAVAALAGVAVLGVLIKRLRRH
ncbi:SRPBCC family protein [Flexivirga oryzae]|uniref:Carbon monoxide dehydrogenase subunit G n=1 Tax=Flexivirga oryzae TaxID=1794944 RepID=A0A839N1S1_9MICO|nr:SRPBCC family protein [Flexivirga oryzae]MBB2891690.1 carbon monoxide dehydrogenase subunit G [Flexivirga oryzae]